MKYTTSSHAMSNMISMLSHFQLLFHSFSESTSSTTSSSCTKKKKPHPQIYLSKNMTKYCDVRTKGVSLLLGTFYSLKCPLIII
ncbi:hypothetical protein JHK85_003630 [Glycine max]|nr:hypothetical protein JHK85_003630 [Glycine max]